MKKIFLLLSLVFLVFMIGNKTYAANSVDIQNLQNAYQTKFGYSLNANNAAQIIDEWQSSGLTYCFLFYSENVYHPNTLPYSYTRAFVTNAFNDNGSAISINSGYKTDDFNSSTSSTLSWSSGVSASMNKNYILNLGTWSDFHTVPIDWDNPLYSANIPTPDYEITYRTLSTTPIVDVPLNVNITNGRETLYVEIKSCLSIISSQIAKLLLAPE